MCINHIEGWENPALPKNQQKNKKKDDSGGP